MADEIRKPDDGELSPLTTPNPALPPRPEAMEETAGAAPTETPSPPPEARRDDDVTTKIFQFLATATPNTLGAVAVGLAASTYFVLGKLGLVLIGAFGGVVLFIQWEARNPEVSRMVKGEKGVDALARLRDELKAAQLNMEPEAQAAEDQERALAQSFDNFPPETREALHELVDAVIRDYVKYWYSPIVPEDKFFPLSCRKTFTSFIAAVSGHLGRKRPADAFLDFLTNTSSIVIVFFSELSAAFSEYPADSKVSASDAIYNYLATNPDSNLANLLSQRQQAGKFRMIADDLLGFLDRQTYDCDPAKVFLREILAGLVLELSLQTCSAPHWINEWIVYLLEAGEPDLSQAIDSGMQTGPSPDNAFIDMDGNLGNVGLTKGNRNSFDMEKARRKESMAHKKKLSKADEELETAMEEMKKMNRMIADEEARRSKEISAAEATERLTDAIKRNADDLDMQTEDVAEKLEKQNGESAPQSSEPSVREIPSDGLSSVGEPVYTPVTPRSTMDTSSQSSSPKQGLDKHQSFTSFDQIVPQGQDEPETSDDTRRAVPLTLHNATITIHDEPGDKSRLRTKPMWDYLVQVEPASSHYPGWMIVRRYSDFETLHEVLRRIATISGATAFTEQHKALPHWKVHTRSSLRGELERYVRDACWYASLAESEGMKRFLEKDLQQQAYIGTKTGLQTIESIGKNVFDVVTAAPKGVVGGVTGVLGNIGIGHRKNTSSSVHDAAVPTPNRPLSDVTAASRLSISTPPRMDSGLSLSNSAARKSRDSLDSQRSSVISTQPGKIAPMERRPSYNSQGEVEPDGLRVSRMDRWDRPSPTGSGPNSRAHSRASSMGPLRSPSTGNLSLSGMKLPPPPDSIPDDYESPISPANRMSGHFQAPNFGSPARSATISSEPAGPIANGSVANGGVSNGAVTNGGATNGNIPSAGTANGSPAKTGKAYTPLTEPETRVAVELIFAIINELYTLSSAWNIRRTLLAAAKSFLLRPGNPSLIAIQKMIQSTVLDANASDAGIAAHLKKLRENTMPTDEERAAWPALPTAEEKEKVRIKARRLLIQSGVPAALMGVMGQSATSEALGRIFDCLQIEEVSRGLMFGVMLQAVRIVTH